VTVHLPTVNAGLNALSAAFLAAGYVFIRRGNTAAHRKAMLAAFATSSVFLVSYLYHHAHAGVTRFQGTGAARTVYFWLLGTHTFLAAALLPLVLTALWKAGRGDFARHKAWARVAWPVWMYVSVTGVVVTWMLYYRG
jgi:putative membrane protein